MRHFGPIAFAIDYTLRTFGGRHPLCGIGVTSLIEITVNPFAFKARIAASRPDPTPLTKTETSVSPYCFTLSAASFTITDDAYGVDFFGPRNPTVPADDPA